MPGLSRAPALFYAAVVVAVVGGGWAGRYDDQM